MIFENDVTHSRSDVFWSLKSRVCGDDPKRRIRLKDSLMATGADET
jgi:hypothetical protein